MHFAFVADKLDLSSSQRRLEKYNLDCAVNKLLCVAPTARDKCTPSHLIFDLATFLCFTRVFDAVLLDDTEIISRAKSTETSGLVFFCWSIF